jgi:hypothetical protein
MKINVKLRMKTKINISELKSITFLILHVTRTHYNFGYVLDVRNM